MVNAHSDQGIIDAYLTSYRSKSELPEWCEQAISAIESDPKSLLFILKLLKSCKDDEEVAFVAAGPLENLLHRHHVLIEKELDTMVRKHDVMRRAIQGVWLQKGDKARDVLDRILSKYGLQYGSR